MNSLLNDIDMKFEEPHKPLCRVCLRYESQIEEKTKSVVSSIYVERNGYLVYKMINYIANVNIQPDDGLLDKICIDCTLELDNAVHFRQKCIVSNRILLSNLRFSGHEQEQEMEGSLKFNKALTEQEKPQSLKFSVGLKEFNELKQESKVNCHEKYSSYDYMASSPVSDDLTVNFRPSEEQEDVNNEATPPKRIRMTDLKLICHDCGESFRTKCKLRVHWKKMHHPKTLICNVCKMQFKSYKALHTHRKRKLQSCTTAGKIRIEGEGRFRRFYCKDCDYATHRIRDMTNHLNIHTGERPWACKLCPKSFTQQSVLQSHLETFHKNYLVELTCHLCGKHCKGRSAIYRHMVTHQKSTYECDVCGIILTRKSSLLLHLKRHSDKYFFCEICPSRFYTNYELHSHKVRVHDRTKKLVRKRYHCELCAYNTTHNKIMKTHRGKHTDSNVACEKCGKFYENEEKLNLHKKQHFERYHECPQCKNTYYTKEQLRIHVKRRHTITFSNFSSKNPNNVKLVKKEVEHGNYYDISDTMTPAL